MHQYKLETLPGLGEQLSTPGTSTSTGSSPKKNSEKLLASLLKLFGDSPSISRNLARGSGGARVRRRRTAGRTRSHPYAEGDPTQKGRSQAPSISKKTLCRRSRSSKGRRRRSWESSSSSSAETESSAESSGGESDAF
nr:ORF3 [Torque teno mustelid virus 2]